MMRRRDFITLLGGAATWPFAARAQKPEKIARIGYLSAANPRSMPAFQAFEQRLRELGYRKDARRCSYRSRRAPHSSG
jgi:putative tryptophan/tyrosine transport system substrate-binding protein